VDTNIVFSAVLRPGRVRSLLFSGLAELHAPQEILGELRSIEGKAAKYLDVRLYREALDRLPRVITLHHAVEYGYLEETAKHIAGRFDLDDWPFIALAMHLQAPLWTGDKAVLEYTARTGYKNYMAIDTEGVELLLRGEPLDGVLERMKEKYVK